MEERHQVLSGIHPILVGDLLAGLDRLGHGDELVVADANFPAHTVGATVVETPGLASPAVVAAIRTVIPLDEYEAESVLLMRAEGEASPGVSTTLAPMRWAGKFASAMTSSSPCPSRSSSASRSPTRIGWMPLSTWCLSSMRWTG